jgi:predicted transcriptional regulator
MADIDSICHVFEDIFVPTTIHVPDRLLAAVDRRARALRISRNRLIVRALERELDQAASWSPGFFEAVREVGPGTAETVDEMILAIRKRRSSKKPPTL